MERKSGRPILVVEDVEEILLHLERTLRQRGHEVVSAANAEEALQIAEQTAPLMILTDLDLPTLDQLIKLVREHRALSGLPIAVIDINHPTVRDQQVKVLPDFKTLDNLVDSLSSSADQS